MMKMIVKTSSNETYEKTLVSVKFYNGKLIVTDDEGSTETYSQRSLDSGMITIM